MPHEKTTLSLVTMPEPPPPVVCDGTYTCQCEPCTTEKAGRVALGIRPKPQLPGKTRRLVRAA